jgi:2'-5' RNA ligase
VAEARGEVRDQPADRRVADPPTMTMPVRRAADAIGEDVLTIGVAIEIPPPHGPALQRWRAEFGDPQAEAIPPHVTLLPPTAVPPGSAEVIGAHLAAVAARTAPFALLLRGTDSFRPVSSVVFVAVREGAPGCDALQRRVRTGPLARELTFPYHPHVTVAHDLSDAALDRAQHTLRDYEAGFTVEAIGLYEHGPDGVWRLHRRFGFGAAA